MRRPFKVLTPYEAKIAGALARTMYPRTELPPDHMQQRALEYVDAWLLAIPARERTLIRLMFVMFEISMPLFGPSRTRRFTQAKPEDQRAYLATWESSNLYFRRIALSGLRSVLSLAYFADADVQRMIGVQDGVEVLRRQRDRSRAGVADRPGPDIDPSANVAVLADAVEVVRNLDRERREREGGPVAASGGES